MQHRLLDILLSTKAIHLSADTPFQWASGWLSPIYTDNRKALSSHEAREIICNFLTALIQTHYPQAEALVGVATGGIAMGAIAAHALRMPFAYVRPKPKDHGMGNQIEGHVAPGAKVVVVEDLISTGGSSLSAVQALRDAGMEVVGMVAIFTYAFPQAEENFAKAGVELHTISSYPQLLERLKDRGEITQEQLQTLGQWRQNPSEWGR